MSIEKSLISILSSSKYLLGVVGNFWFVGNMDGGIGKGVDMKTKRQSKRIDVRRLRATEKEAVRNSENGVDHDIMLGRVSRRYWGSGRVKK